MRRRLSAALVVRNEACFIEGCLSSIAPHVDEIVLVDTGSRDDTIEIARRFPITLHQFAWRDDFAAARNVAIELASGDWILYIDADERLRVPSPERLHDLLEDDQKVAWNVRFHPRIHATPYLELRLFRNDPRIRFRGLIHERVHDAVAEVMRIDGKTTATCDLTLLHVGYEDDQTRKNPRNIPLLRARLKRDPNHLYSWWHLGQCLLLDGDQGGAAHAWSKGAAIARGKPASARCPSDAQSLVSLIKLRIEKGEDIAALLREALTLYPNHLVLRWLDAKLALDRGDTEAAEATLEFLATMDADTFLDPGISYDKALFRHLAKEALALCHFRAGRFRDAAHFYRLAAEHAPNRAECELKARLAELKIDTSVERLMGNKPEARFGFIHERAEFADEEMLEV